MKKKIYAAAAILLTAALLFSGFQLWRYYHNGRQSQNHFDGITEQIIIPPEISPEWTVDKQYGELFAQNPDMIGWIYIVGTNVNYPVMQTPKHPNYYLKRNFEKQYSNHGVPYVSANCEIDPQSDNIIVYGHNMKDGSMFSALIGYRNKGFWKANPIIRFDTRAGFGRYEVVTVFSTKLEYFPYDSFIDFEDEHEFEKYLHLSRAFSYYDTGVTAEYGDKLLTLSTCDYGKDYRLVVVAKKI